MVINVLTIYITEVNIFLFFVTILRFINTRAYYYLGKIDFISNNLLLSIDMIMAGRFFIIYCFVAFLFINRVIEIQVCITVKAIKVNFHQLKHD